VIPPAGWVARKEGYEKLELTVKSTKFLTIKFNFILEPIE
jgi:hypothetical protein